MERLVEKIMLNRDKLSRLSMAIIYIWFGFPKILNLSAAEKVVTDLSEILFPFLPSATFLLLLGIFEVGLGLLFLYPKATKYVVVAFYVHILSTFMPLIFLADQTWQSPFILTLTGQYIAKNIVLMALVLNIYTNWKNGSNQSQG